MKKKIDKMEKGFRQEIAYIKAKKQAKKIKNLYIHIIFSSLLIPAIVIINLTIIEPQFHWFWFGVGGILLGVFFHWLDVYGFNIMGFNKGWEERKIKELMEEEKNN